MLLVPLSYLILQKSQVGSSTKTCFFIMSYMIVCPKSSLRQSDLPMVSAFLFALASGSEKDHSEEISSKWVSCRMSVLLIMTYLSNLISSKTNKWLKCGFCVNNTKLSHVILNGLCYRGKSAEKNYRKKDVWSKRSNKITVLDTNSWSLAFYWWARVCISSETNSSCFIGLTNLGLFLLNMICN